MGEHHIQGIYRIINMSSSNKTKKVKRGNRTRFDSIKKKPRKSLDQRRKVKEEQVKCREMYKQLIQKKEDKKQELRSRCEENRKREEANRAKSEVVQIIKNPEKIKKKQLRSITKRDVLNSN